MGIFDADPGETVVSTASGAGTGALLGAGIGALGGPIGAGAGALLGGGVGLLRGIFASSGRKKAAEAQRRALEQAMARLEALGKQQYDRRMADLDKTMALFNPTEAEWNFAYGSPLPSTGQGPWSYVNSDPSRPRPPGAPPAPPPPSLGPGANNKGRLF